MMENKFNLKLQKTREYLDYLERHYNNVQRAFQTAKIKWQVLNIENKDYFFESLQREIEEHDLSKFSRAEFVQYRELFFSISKHEKEIATGYIDDAFNNHLLFNYHHFERIREAYPNSYVHIAHMCLDWIAMGYEFNDTALEYFFKNKKRMGLPQQTETFVLQLLTNFYKQGE